MLQANIDMKSLLKMMIALVLIPSILVLICNANNTATSQRNVGGNPAEKVFTLPGTPIAVVSKEESNHCPVYDKFRVIFSLSLRIINNNFHFYSASESMHIVSVCHDKMPKYLQTMCFKN